LKEERRETKFIQAKEMRIRGKKQKKKKKKNKKKKVTLSNKVYLKLW
jgi:hypothetical protein